jgi:hypothetical protein
MKPTYAEIANRFRHHPPRGDQATRYAAVRGVLMQAAMDLVNLTPDCDEQRRAVDALDSAMMLFNAAIARHTPPDEPPANCEAMLFTAPPYVDRAA